LWTVPNNHNARAKNVKKPGAYYVRIESNSHEGVKLVGNAGPFTISPQDSNGGTKTLAEEIAQPMLELKRREDAATPDANFRADFALHPNRPSPVSQVIYSPEIPTATIPAAPVVPAPISTGPASSPPEVGGAPVDVTAIKGNVASGLVDTNIPVDIDTVTGSSGSNVPNGIDAPVVAVGTTDKTIPPNANVPSDPSASAAAPVAEVAAPVTAPTATGDSAVVPAFTEIPEAHNIAPQDEIHPPVTEIAHSSFIPSKVLLAGAVAGGAIGAGILGASFFGQVGGVIGAVVGGVIGGVAVLLHVIGVPV